MNKQRVFGFVSALALAAGLSSTAIATTIDTDTGRIDFSNSSFNGTSFTAHLDNGIMQFRFAGDLVFNNNDLVRVQGSNALSLFAANNVSIGANVRFDLSANGITAGAGGDGGNGGRGGDGFQGGGVFATDLLEGTRGSMGTSGDDGSTGSDGSRGSPGGRGSAGIGGGFGGSGGIGGAQGTGSEAGLGGDRATGGGQAGTESGSCANVIVIGLVCTTGDGENGKPGGAGNPGSRAFAAAGAGGDGGDGSGGVNFVAGPAISGGGGGGGGGSGGGGSGGGGGGGGGGGRGGGGGAGGVGLVFFYDGGGGGGGGAVEISALGKVSVGTGSQFQANGGNGTANPAGLANRGGNGSLAEDGDDGNDASLSGENRIGNSGGAGGSASLSGGSARGQGGFGDFGEDDVTGLIDGGTGGSGGSGGSGARGQTGGNGGSGGDGGGGAGGTVKLAGTDVSGSGTISVNTSGGLNGSGSGSGGDGRYLLASNTAGGPAASVQGGGVQTFAGPMAANPFIKGGGTATPYIADLVGGAEIFGLLAGVDADDAAIQAALGPVPGGADLALLRLDVGPGAYAVDYTGFDMLMLINLTMDSLIDPELGIDPAGLDIAFTTGLLSGGVANNPLFGSGGFAGMGSLPGLGIFATLIPENGTVFNAAVGGETWIAGADLANGEAAFGPAAVPAPSAALLLGVIAVAGWIAGRRRAA